MGTTKPQAEPKIPNRHHAKRRGRGGGTIFVLLVLATALSAAWTLLGATGPEGPREAVFPLPERYSGTYSNDWGASRVQGKHEGTDILAPEGTPIRSITAGTVTSVFGSGAGGWNTLGGYTVMIEAAYDVGPTREDDRLYYAHMRAPTRLEPGEEVRAGQKIGEVGDSGQGPPGTRGKFEPHLHLGWYAGRGFFQGDRAQAASGAMDPYPLLRRIERGGFQIENRNDQGPP